MKFRKRICELCGFYVNDRKSLKNFTVINGGKNNE